MGALTLQVAVSLAGQAIAAGRTISAAPLAIAVLDGGGHLVTLQREDGASLLRPQIAIGKAWGAIALGKGSRLLALDAPGQVLGAMGISGDTSDIDEQCAIRAIEALGLMADAGVSA